MLLCEVEAAQGIAQLFDVPPLPYEERRVASGPNDGGDVYALAIEPEAALLEYLDMYYRLGRAERSTGSGWSTSRPRSPERARRAADREGVRGGLPQQAEQGRPPVRRDRARRAPTGRIARFLNVNSELAGLAKVGPIRTQADSIMTCCAPRGPRCTWSPVLEDMPVRGDTDGITELHAAKRASAGWW